MLLTTREVADLLRVHPKHVYRLMRRGLPAGRVGDEWRFDREAVLAWARQRDGGAEAPGGGAPAASDDDGARAPLGDGAPALLAANGDVAVDLVLDALWREPGPGVGFVRADHGAGIELLRRRAVLLCGFHETNALPSFDAPLARLHLVEREVGVAFAPGRAPRPLAELGGLRLATRPPSAGVRSHLDAALRREGVDAAALGRGAVAYASHQDVVFALARGEAEAGLTTGAWAARLGLAFRPIASEPYALLLFARDLGRPEVRRLRSMLASKAMRSALEAGTGYDARRAGEAIA